VFHSLRESKRIIERTSSVKVIELAFSFQGGRLSVWEVLKSDRGGDVA
jgi:hypothetical protein